jgi:4-hydroxy-4-methyl-2-oxoglutarate aldolase
MIHVATTIERPRKELIDKFRGLSTATVHEASGRKGAVDCDIKPITKGVRICGPAFTVQCHPGDNLMLHKALEKAQPGDVVVASVGGHYEAGYWGALMATSALARSFGGLAIDGCVRDSAEMIDMGFPVFCRGFCIRGTTKAILDDLVKSQNSMAK